MSVLPQQLAYLAVASHWSVGLGVAQAVAPLMLLVRVRIDRCVGRGDLISGKDCLEDSVAIQIKQELVRTAVTLFISFN